MRTVHFHADHRTSDGKIAWTPATWTSVIAEVKDLVAKSPERTMKYRQALTSAQKLASVTLKRNFTDMSTASIIMLMSTNITKHLLKEAGLAREKGRFVLRSNEKHAYDMSLDVTTGRNRTVYWGPRAIEALAKAVVAVKDRHVVGGHVMHITCACVLLEKAQEMVFPPKWRRNLTDDNANSKARRALFLKKEVVVNTFLNHGLTILNDHILRKEERTPRVLDTIEVEEIIKPEPTVLQQIRDFHKSLEMLQSELLAMREAHNSLLEDHTKLREDHLALQELIGLHPEEKEAEETSPENPPDNKRRKVYVVGPNSDKAHILKSLRLQFKDVEIHRTTRDMSISEFKDSLVIMTFDLVPRTEDRSKIEANLLAVPGVAVRCCRTSAVPTIIRTWIGAGD